MFTFRSVGAWERGYALNTQLHNSRIRTQFLWNTYTPVLSDLNLIPRVLQIFCNCTEEVRHDDITVGGKHVWNVLTVDRCSFYCLRGILLLFELWQVQVLWMLSKCKVQTKVSRVQVHSLSGEPTRSLGVCLTSRSMHLCSSEYQNNSLLYSAQTDCQFYYGNLYWKRRARLGSRDLVIPPLVTANVGKLCGA